LSILIDRDSFSFCYASLLLYLPRRLFFSFSLSVPRPAITENNAITDTPAKLLAKLSKSHKTRIRNMRETEQKYSRDTVPNTLDRIHCRNARKSREIVDNPLLNTL
jgi:hypothetical protein